MADYSPTRTVRGTVADSKTGGPVDGARATLLDGTGAAVAGATSGADGSFEMSGVPEGPNRVAVAAAGDQRGARTVTVSAPPRGAAAEPVLLHLSLEPFPTEPVSAITGVVIDNGGPVAGATVRVAEDFDGDGSIDFSAAVITGPDGSYRIPVPRANWTYTTRVEAPVRVGGQTVVRRSSQSSAVGDARGSGGTFSATRAIGGLLLLAGSKTDDSAAVVPLPPGVRVEATLVGTGAGQAQRQVQVGSDGSYTVGGVTPGEYQIHFQVITPDGQKLAGTTATVKVERDGALALQTTLIDPYGTVTDAATGLPVAGVKMRLMWADTELNRRLGRKPDTEVALPLLSGFPPSDNADPQWTSAAGQYAWMVFPDADYYLLAEKEGYLTYDSRQEKREVPVQPGEDSYVQGGIIHVGESIVKYHLWIQPKSGVHRAYITGYPDGEVKPDRPLTRAEVATMLARLTGAAAPAQADLPYSDVAADHWARPYIAAAAAAGLLRGDPDGAFRPEAPLSRAEAAVIAMRLRYLVPLPGASFSDLDGHWAAGAVQSAVAAGIVRGLPDGSYAPTAASRAAPCRSQRLRAAAHLPAGGWAAAVRSPRAPPGHRGPGPWRRRRRKRPARPPPSCPEHVAPPLVVGLADLAGGQPPPQDRLGGLEEMSLPPLRRIAAAYRELL